MNDKREREFAFKAKVRASREAEPVKVFVTVVIDDADAAIALGAKLALIRWQDEVRRLGTLPSDGEHISIRVSDYLRDRRSADPADRVRRELAKLSPAEREALLRDLGLL